MRAGLRNVRRPLLAARTNSTLWTAVNERDRTGQQSGPDYMTEVKAGAFYGFPYSYYGQHVDTRVKPQRPDLVATAIVPDYALGNRTASLGLVFLEPEVVSGALLGRRFRGSARIMEPQAAPGYKVIFVPFAHGKPAAESFLSGFLTADGACRGTSRRRQHSTREARF